MNFSFVSQLSQRKKADVIAIPFWQEKARAQCAAEIGDLTPLTAMPIQLKDFSGKEEEILFLYSSHSLEKRIVLLGLGDKKKSSVEKLRRAYSSLIKAFQAKKIIAANLIIPEISSLEEDQIVRGIAEGLLLSNYAFEKLKKDSLKKETTVLMKKAVFIGLKKKSSAAAKKATSTSEGVYLARDLVNANADDMTPQALAHCAENLAKKFPNVKVTVFDKSRIQKEKMGLLLAVSRSSLHDPVFIIVEYRGQPKSQDHTVLVGKGVTFDTGGLNLKPTGSMETMKCDMSGAAAVLGTILAAATLDLKRNITAIIPATENSIGAKSYKPGDVYASYEGKTVEVNNTDAEGRLILADALAYANKNLKPTRLITFATLTGAVVIALGEETTGLMSNNNQLAHDLTQSGESTFERVCRLPLFEEYRQQLESDIADIKNSGGRGAGTITAALFLQEFVGKTPWAHLDIAGTAYLSKARRYNPKNASGIGVRLMIEYFLTC